MTNAQPTPSRKALIALLTFLREDITPKTDLCRELQEYGLMKKDTAPRRWGKKRWWITMTGVEAAINFEKFYNGELANKAAA